MKLVDVKRTSADKKADKERWTEPGNAEDYPYGLEIRLDDATIKKRGLGGVGAEQPVRIQAEAFVSEDSANKRNGKTTRNVTLQITKLAVSHGETNEDKANAMYGDK